MIKKQHLLVMKFGGTSVGSINGLKNVLSIVEGARQEWETIVVVTSAFSGVTDAILDSVRQAALGDLACFEQTRQMLLERHREALLVFVNDQQQRQLAEEAIDQLIAGLTNLVRAVAILGESTPRALDAIVGYGERLASRVLTYALRACEVNAETVDATRLIVSDLQFQAAVPDFERTESQANHVLQPLFDAGKIPVVTGFIAATRRVSRPH